MFGASMSQSSPPPEVQIAHNPKSKKRARISESGNQSLNNLSCRRCRSRKVKCDGAFPNCGGCEKAGVPCLAADYSTAREYTRAEVYELEEKARRLEALLGENAASNAARDPSPHPAAGSSPGRNVQRDSDAASSRYVGGESGTSFVHYMLNAIRKNCTSSFLPSLLAEKPANPSMIYHAPHSCPSREDAVPVVMEYLRHFQVLHPFLEHSRIWRVFSNVYDSPEVDSRNPSTLLASQRQDLFQLNMILAIGSLTLFRAGSFQQHPFGFFTAALQIIAPSGFCFGAIEDIENFLLIAQFGVLHYIGCSVWEVCQICIRICVELKLHRKTTRALPTSNKEEQRRRRVFWECYHLDRFSSAMLGRPFGIDDADIDIGLPYDIDDTMLEDSSGFPVVPVLDANSLQNHRSEMTIFVYHLRLARITSRIYYAIYSRPTPSVKNSKSSWNTSTPSPENVLPPGEIFVLLKTFLEELQQWRSNAPFYFEPRCLYENEAYFEFTYQKERLALIRSAIDRVPSRGPFPPNELLASCIKAASAVIRIYNNLRKNDLVTYTRSYSHLIFSSGLVVIFSVFVQIHPLNQQPTQRSGVDVTSWWAELQGDSTPEITPHESLQVLKEAAEILSWMADEMPDMVRYALFIDALRRELQHIVNHQYKQTTSNKTNAVPTASGSRSQGLTSNIENGSVAAFHDGHLELPFNEAGLPSQFDLTQYTYQTPDGTSVSSMQTNATFDALVNEFIRNDESQRAFNHYPNSLELSTWPFSQVPLMEEIAFGLSDYDWDMPIPWETSPMA